MSVLKVFKYLDGVMCGSTLVVLEAVTDHLDELSFMQSDLTTESVTEFKKEVNFFMDNELGVNPHQLLKDSTFNVNSYAFKAYKWMKIIRQQIDTHFDDEQQDKIFDQLGFTAHWEGASGGQQVKMVNLLETYNLHLPKFLKLMISKGIGEKMLIEAGSYCDKIKSSNTKQEYLKRTTPEMNDAKREKLNDIYKRIIGICKIAQLFYKDEPAIRDKFVFSKIAEAMTHRYHKLVEEVEEV